MRFLPFITLGMRSGGGLEESRAGLGLEESMPPPEGMSEIAVRKRLAENRRRSRSPSCSAGVVVIAGLQLCPADRQPLAASEAMPAVALLAAGGRGARPRGLIGRPLKVQQVARTRSFASISDCKSAFIPKKEFISKAVAFEPTTRALPWTHSHALPCGHGANTPPLASHLSSRRPRS